MKDFTIINRENHETDFLPIESVVTIDHMSASDFYGYDEEKLDNIGYNSYSPIMVFYLNDGTTKVYPTSCQIIIR